jgi:hypothetical protein
MIQRTERGWGGHFICAHRCLFRRNTLIELCNIKIVVSTVGLMLDPYTKTFETIGHDRYFETMAFHAKPNDRFLDADISRQVSFESNWRIDQVDGEIEADAMHEAVVTEIMNRLANGENFIKENDK